MNIEQNEFEALLISSIRYALGRTSGIVLETEALFNKYFEQLSPNTIRIIRESIWSRGYLNNAYGQYGTDYEFSKWAQMYYK